MWSGTTYRSCKIRQRNEDQTATTKEPQTKIYGNTGSNIWETKEAESIENTINESFVYEHGPVYPLKKEWITEKNHNRKAYDYCGKWSQDKKW